MDGKNNPRCLLRVLNLRQGYVELHGELETTLLGGQQAHTAVDRDIAHLGAFTTADHTQGTLEAGRKSHGEELFRVRATALAAPLLWRAELHIQGSVIRAPVAACPAASDRCLRRVKNSRHLGSILGICRLPASRSGRARPSLCSTTASWTCRSSATRAPLPLCPASGGARAACRR